MSALQAVLSSHSPASVDDLVDETLKPPPSIPHRNHSGYFPIASSSGAVLMKVNESTTPSYRGYGEDAVGPGDYEPNVDARFRTSVQTNFTKVGLQHGFADRFLIIQLINALNSFVVCYDSWFLFDYFLIKLFDFRWYE